MSIFPESDFIKGVTIINKTNYVYGNEILYKMCIDENSVLKTALFKEREKNYIFPKNSSDTDAISRLSSAIWLVGKSYSADPTRGRGAEELNKNSGLGLSFDAIAKNIACHEKYQEFYTAIKGIAPEKYLFDFGKKDVEILNSSINAVCLFNDILKGAMGKGSKNEISFCSKLLHFVFPNIFFIIDSFSETGGKTLFSKKTNCRNFYYDNLSSDNIQIDKNAKSFFEKYIKKISNSFWESSNDVEKRYREHCAYAYCLGAFLNDNKMKCEPQIKGISSEYMPRLVDSVLMRIKD